MSSKIRLCIYCGSLATCRDHPDTRSRQAGYRRNKRFHFKGGTGHSPKTVPACFECNRLLHAYPVSDIHQRAEYLYGKLHQRDVSQERLEWCRKVAYLDLD